MIDNCINATATTTEAQRTQSKHTHRSQPRQAQFQIQAKPRVSSRRGDEVEFATLLFFDSLDAVRAFAGKDYETAVIHKDAEPLLTRYDARSTHYETLLQPPART